jgi:mono/diheme cytochrome c family protein
MVFSFNKKDSGKASLVKALAFTAALSLTVLASGCTEQKASVSKDQSALLSAPVVDQRLLQEDFAFPSKTPSLLQGREIYQNQCMACHVQGYWQTPKVKQDLAYTTPIDLYLMLSTGGAPKVMMPTPERRQLLPATHPAFRDKISRDDRWAVLFYARYLAGAGDIKSPDAKTDMAAIFGGNCAVCHGPKGQGDGPLYTAKTGNHELMNGAQVHNLNPAPANFQQYDRIYNRTDAQLLKYVCEGIYPSAMPAWFGDVNVDKDSGKITYIFDEKLLTNMVRYVRTWAYTNDLPDNLPEVKTPPLGLEAINHCNPAPTNRPWTDVMRDNGPNKGHVWMTPPADPITGGMVHVHSHQLPVVSSTASEEAPSTSAATTEPAAHTGGTTKR